jgi:glycerol kinase
MSPGIVINFFLITNQMHQLFKFIVLQNSTCVGHLLCLSSGVFYCTFGTGKFHAVLMTASKQSQDGTAEMMGREDVRNM